MNNACRQRGARIVHKQLIYSVLCFAVGVRLVFYRLIERHEEWVGRAFGGDV